MKVNEKILKQILEIAFSAGKAILEIRKNELNVCLKNDKSPVIKQTGFEIFGGNSKPKDDYEVIKTSLEIFKKSKYKIHRNKR